MADFYAGLHPEDRERVSAAFAAALDPERRARYDVEYRAVGRKDVARLSALARAHDVLTAQSWEGADLRAVLKLTFEAQKAITSLLAFARLVKANECLSETNRTAVPQGRP